MQLPVWFDDSGPVAAVALTDFDRTWQADALLVPGAVELDVVWDSVLDAISNLGAVPDLDPPTIEVLVHGDDGPLIDLLRRNGFDQADDSAGGTTWMAASDRPPVTAPPDGYRIVDRSERHGRPHPMRVRNGTEVEARLRQCSLYDPELDLAIETLAGEPAGYALFWSDPITAVGMLEPMRVEDDHQRRGLGRALLTAGLDRLARAGAERLKVGFDGEAGRNLYLGAGFTLTSTLSAFRRQPSGRRATARSCNASLHDAPEEGQG